MTDDGQGAGIRIPSMLISYSDGTKLMNFLKSASPEELDTVHIIASFEMAKPDNRVEYDIWYSSSNDNSLDFIQDFMKVDKRFGDKVLMTPRVVWWECMDCDQQFKNQFCYGDGKYCSLESPDSKITGKEVLMEDLR